MVDRKINAMHKEYGVEWGKTCKDCSHCMRYAPTDRHYYKCELYGITGSEATDWRLSWVACGMYNVDVNLNMRNTLIEVLKRRQKQNKGPIDGQVELDLMGV